MSGIGSIGSSGAELYQYFRQLSSLSGSQTSGVSASQGVRGRGNAGPMSTPDLTEALEATGLASDEAESLQEQVQSAVATALQIAQDSSAGSTDLREVIKSTIESTLQANGIDPETVRAQMPSPGPGGPPPGGMGPPPPSSSDSSEDQSLVPDLTSALKSLGMDAEQAQSLQDQIESAVTTALQGSTDSSGTSTTSSTNPMEVVKATIENTLEANGLDPEAVRAQLQPPAGGPPPSSCSGATSDSRSSDSSSSSTDPTLTQLTQTLLDLFQQLWGSQSSSSTGTSTAVVGFLFDQVS